MIYGYSRVSTKNQERDGTSLESQEKKLKEAGATEIYSDSFTGAVKNRPQLKILLNKLQHGDTLIITKLDRVARSMTQGKELIDELLKKGITVHIINIGIMDNTPTSRLIRNIFFAFAEFEKDMIIERTLEGKEIAKTKTGFKEGRPKKFTEEQIRHAVKLLEKHSLKEVERMTKISKSTLKRAKAKKQN